MFLSFLFSAAPTLFGHTHTHGPRGKWKSRFSTLTKWTRGWDWLQLQLSIKYFRFSCVFFSCSRHLARAQLLPLSAPFTTYRFLLLDYVLEPTHTHTQVYTQWHYNHRRVTQNEKIHRFYFFFASVWHHTRNTWHEMQSKTRTNH